MTEEERAARAARAAQRAAEAPSREGAERAQQRASRRPTAAQASANQAAGGNYADRRNLLINQGQDEYNRAVTRDATKIPRAPGGQRTGYGSPGVPPPPSPFGAAANAAGTAAATGARTVARGVVGRVPVVGDLANSRSAGSGSSLTSNAEGAAAVQQQAAEREARLTMSDPNYAETADAAAATLRARTQARQTTRPTTRMSPREMSPDELHNIYSLTNDPESSIAEMRGPHGQAARNIIARRTELAREAELEGMKRGGPVKKMAKGGVVKSSASGRSDGCAVKGKTKGRMV